MVKKIEDIKKGGSRPRTSAKQRRTRFIKEFLIDKNATRAAIAAGYSEKTAYAQASRLLKDVKVRSQIETENDKVNEKLGVTVERVRDELAKLAFYDPRKLFKEDGTLRPISELDDDTAAVIAGMDVNELFEGNGEERSQVGYAKKIKLADKGLNLERLGRYLKMFVDRVEVTGDAALLERLTSGRKRNAGL